MEDMGWCPLIGCNSLANVEKAENTGRCQHCEFLFCLDCKNGAHPYKRCLLNRLDVSNNLSPSELKQILETNKKLEAELTALFMKFCTKPCPN